MELQNIQNKIHEIRGQKVMLDFDLAELYEVETKVLNQAVKRNPDRFPERFMFRLRPFEWERIRSQIVTASDQSKRNVAVTPYAFTEHGVTMLSSVLRSKKAIEVNIAIVDAFIAIKEYALNYKELAMQLRDLEGRFSGIAQAIDYLLQKDHQDVEQKQRKRIGYKTD
ncbi:MAG TPA: ORF6N domain-containing protein [Bacteroidales bacterium]|nr:ORF6N domain-containing protein [Bacteroidales bacterium]